MSQPNKPKSPSLAVDLLTPVSSQVSVGFGSDLSSPSSSSIVSPAVFCPITVQWASERNAPRPDECCIALYCVRHDRILLWQCKRKPAYFFPRFPIRDNDSWTVVATKALASLLTTQQLPIECLMAPLSLDTDLVDIRCISPPQMAPDSMTRVIFVAAIQHDPTKETEIGCCESQTGKTFSNNFAGEITSKWFTNEELQATDVLWGPEPCLMFASLRDHAKQCETKGTGTHLLPLVQKQYSTEDAVRYLITDDSIYQTEKELLLSARFTVEEVPKLWNEFAVQCFPSQYMCFSSFRVFMNKLDWFNEEESLLRCLFHSFTASASDPSPAQRPVPYLTFEDLLLGLAAMEERTDHRCNCLRVRLTYIFFFYDIDADDRLNVGELSQMATDIARKTRSRGMSIDFSRSREAVRRDLSTSNSNGSSSAKNDVDVLISEMFNRICGIESVTESSYLTLQQLLDAAESEQHGAWLAELTEHLFRSNNSSIDLVAVKFDPRPPIEKMSLLKAQTALTRYDQPCDRCHFVTLHVCAHLIKSDKFGSVCSTIKLDINPQYNDIHFKAEMDRIALEHFNIVNTVLNWTSQLASDELAALSRVITTTIAHDTSISMSDTCKPVLADIKTMLTLAKEVLKREPLLCHTQSPCYVLGEVQSNLASLYALLSIIHRTAPFVNPVNFVLLGNYVDTGQSGGVETVLYLLCLKILIPNRLIMLRGVTEFRATTEKTKFHQECLERFDAEVWSLIHEVYDLLPYAATVDQRVFLTKSGIPLVKQTVKRIFAPNHQEVVTTTTTTKSPITTIDAAPYLECLLTGKPVARSKLAPIRGGGVGSGGKPQNSINSRTKSNQTSSYNNNNNSKQQQPQSSSTNKQQQQQRQVRTSASRSNATTTSSQRKSSGNNNNKSGGGSKFKLSGGGQTSTKGGGGGGKKSHKTHKSKANQKNSKRRSTATANTTSKSSNKSNNTTNTNTTTTTNPSARTTTTTTTTNTSNTHSNSEISLSLSSVPIVVDFTVDDLREFMRRNAFHYVIRTERLPLANNNDTVVVPAIPYRAQCRGRLLTLGAICKQSLLPSSSSSPDTNGGGGSGGGNKHTTNNEQHVNCNKLNASIVLINRMKLRVIRLETVNFGETK